MLSSIRTRRTRLMAEIFRLDQMIKSKERKHLRSLNKALENKESEDLINKIKEDYTNERKFLKKQITILKDHACALQSDIENN